MLNEKLHSASYQKGYIPQTNATKYNLHGDNKLVKAYKPLTFGICNGPNLQSGQTTEKFRFRQQRVEPTGVNYSGDVKNEITGVLYHTKMTHIWRWMANREAPIGLREGIEDFVRLKVGNAPSHRVKPGEGNRWDQGYDVAAHFLDYCDGLLSGFVAGMNKKMESGCGPEYFVELLGKDSLISSLE